jgi:hypothetical protein
MPIRPLLLFATVCNLARDEGELRRDRSRHLRINIAANAFGRQQDASWGSSTKSES